MPQSIRTLFLHVFLLWALPATAQFSFTPVGVGQVRTAAPLPVQHALLQAPVGLVEALESTGRHVRLTIPIPGRNLEVRGSGFSLFTPEAVLIERSADGERSVAMPRHGLFHGTIDGLSGSSVFIAAFENHVVGIIEVPEPEGRRRWLISPDTIIAGRPATHVVYEVTQGVGTPRQCLSETLPNYQQRADSIMQMVTAWERAKGAEGDEPQDATLRTLQLALDCTQSFYRNLGNNLATAATSAIAIIGADAMIFLRDANVVVRVPYLRVWTVADPYPGDIGEKLGRVRDHWNDKMQHVNRSVTCLLSGEGGGGLAWVGVLCGGYGYNVSGVDGRVNFPAPGYQWDVDVTSHELGHNIGSSHTHNCGWNPPIDSCWNAEGGCYQGTRTRRGTIMSYCHLQSLGTELQFHPRVATLFNRVLANSPCTGPERSQHDTDLAVVDIRMPINGATIIAGQAFTPSAVVRNVGRVAITGAQVRCVLTRLDNSVSRNMLVTMSRLEPGQTQEVSFTPMTLDTAESYLMRAAIELRSDKFSTNNAMTRPFRVAAADSGTVRVTSPNGGETLVSGRTAKITFTASKAPTVFIEYSTNSGAEWFTVQRSVESSAGEYTWAVPFTPSRTCLVRIRSTTNSGASDVSDAPFTISTQRDAEAFDIVDPSTEGVRTTPFVPLVVIRNNGTTDLQDVSVRLTMRWNRATGYSYDTTIVHPLLKGLARDTIALRKTPVLANGVHIMEMFVDAKDDSNKTNNRFWREFNASGLNPPYNVRLEAGPNRVILQWSLLDVDPTARIELWRGESLTSLERVRTLRPSVNTYVDDGLINGRRYFYALRTVRGSQVSVFSSAASEQPMSFPAGGSSQAPSLISPRDGAQGVPALIDLVWTSVQGADQYEINVANDESFQDLERVYVVRDAGDIVVPLDFNVTRRWRVRAMNQSVIGPWSTTSTFITTRNCAGSALSFNGSGSKGTDTSLTWRGGPVTVEFWTYVKRSTLRPTSTFMVGLTDNGGNRFQGHVPWEDGRIYWDYGDIGAKGRISAPFGDGNYDRWTHIALVSNGSTFKAIYVNGELVAQANDAASPADLKELTIGGMRGGTWFNGMVDEFRLWNVVRSGEEIRTTMARRMPQPSENSKVVGWWRCDEGSGVTTRDAVRGRTLTLNAQVLWSPSQAGILCEDPVTLEATEFTSGTGTAPAVRSALHDVSWRSVSAPRGALWYQLQVVDTASKRVMIEVDNIPSVAGSTTITYPLRGLPSDSTVTVQVRPRGTYGDGRWATSSITTRTPCSNHAITFEGNGNRLISDDFLYSGRAATVEYWSLVDSSQVMNSVSFMIGQADNESRRFQSHAPWGDRNLYWDFGNWRELGRVSTSYASNIGKWTHVALVSNGHDSMAIYFNGVRAANSVFTGQPGELRQLTLGGNPFSRTYWKGTMRDFRVWNTMRSEKQIQSSMFDRLTEPRSGLLGSWLLNEGSGLRSVDATLRNASARSDVEFRWDVAGSKLAHASAVVRGRRIVQRGDTAAYDVREVRDASHSWAVIGGTLQTNPTLSTAIVKWNESDTTGTLVLTRTYPGGCKDETRVSVSLPLMVSVDEPRDDEAAPFHAPRMMPNPATDIVRVTVPATASVEIVDVHGRTLLRREFASGGHDVDVSALAQGTYYVRFVMPLATHVSTLTIRR
ncbi:MAG: hypothetical protein RIR53_1090 [Bacteroidota bacterium]